MTYTAIDCETTGFTASDVTTVVGFVAYDDEGNEQYHVHYNAEKGVVDEGSFTWGDGETVLLNEHMNEEDLLSGLTDALKELDVLAEQEMPNEGTMLVGYNAETYSGGFDFPFLRTRCATLGVDWPFAGVNYTDVQDAMKTAFNTKAIRPKGFNKKPLKQFGYAIGAPVDDGMYKSDLVDAVEDHGYSAEQVREYANAEDKDLPTSSLGSLDEIYSLLRDDEPEDPFDGDSAQAVTAWQEGNVADIVRHNLSDLQKTLRLMELVESYVHENSLSVVRL